MNLFRILLAGALLASGTAWSHGDKPDHADQTVRKEQKAWGIAAEPRQVTRTVTLTMSDDMRFTPSHIDVKQGETLRLRVRNAGKLLHELVLGTRAELDAHAALMLKFPGMEHDEPYMTHVSPGKRGDIIWTFNRAGDFEFACLIAGHYQAGMKGTVRVRAAPGAMQTPASPAPEAALSGHSGMQHGMQHGAQVREAPGAKSGPATQQPYAGQQQREIKALSAQDLQAYVQGEGHGFAKAAELNGYPGPLHVLQLARELQLSEEQRSRSEALLERHKNEARRLGQEVIEAERALDLAFAHRNIDADSLLRLTLTAGERQAQLRSEHLRTHLAQTALLSPQQVDRYISLRGYGGDAPRPKHGMEQEMNHKEMHHESTKH